MKKILLIIFLLLLLIAGVIGYLGYQQVYGSFVKEKLIFRIPSNSEYEEVKQLLHSNNLIQNDVVFDYLAERMNFIKSPMRSGQFEIEKNWSTYDLLKQLRNGPQKASDVVVNITWTVEHVAGRLDDNLEIDSLAILTTIMDEQLQEELFYTEATAMALFVPNTYQVYWNTTGADLIRRMKKESDQFWAKEDRLSKADALNMSSEEVYTLASIVERETNQNEEKQRMAGVYLNRIQRGIPLQADPTVKFGIGDLGIKRILNKHLAFDSPYNTYIYKGLPPGPISMASIASIDAVLNAEKHNYLYFCRKPDETGLHAFAKTLSQHNANARAYHRWYNLNFD